MVLLKHSGLKFSFLSDEVMSAVDENPEEAMLRKFFQGILQLLLNDSPNILMKQSFMLLLCDLQQNRMVVTNKMSICLMQQQKRNVKVK